MSDDREPLRRPRARADLPDADCSGRRLQGEPEPALPRAPRARVRRGRGRSRGGGALPAKKNLVRDRAEAGRYGTVARRTSTSKNRQKFAKNDERSQAATMATSAGQADPTTLRRLHDA